MGALQTLTKQPSENRLYEMKFDALLGPDETIESILSVEVVPSVVGSVVNFIDAPIISLKSIFQRIKGGQARVSYKITFVVFTTDGNTIEGEGRLIVTDI